MTKPKIGTSAASLRIKVTGVCNRSCHFCNEEGDMKGIGGMQADSDFSNAITSLQEAFGISKIMFTGGEPTIHPHFAELVSSVDAGEVSVTTNGVRLLNVKEWESLKESGLSRVIISIHDASPQDFLSLETRKRNIGWAINSLENQRQNCLNAAIAGLDTRVNVVLHSTFEKALAVLEMLAPIQVQTKLGVRILNDLSATDKSKVAIRSLCQALEATLVSSSVRKGSSNKVDVWSSADGFQFEIKEEYPYYLESVCGGCRIRHQCREGFYGIRLEVRGGAYFVRLCAYKNSSDVLMPLEEFLNSPVAKAYMKTLSL
jgi:molybdenum cofactor biosynthesis enzyme MoaA